MKRNILYAALMLFSVSCTEEFVEITQECSIPIELAADYPAQTVTRATENGFVAEDAVGVFVVDYNSDGTPGEPMLKGNRASNTRFEYDGSKWSASYQLYWADSKTPADFYGYYPFDISLSSVTDYVFSVECNQDTIFKDGAAYEKSDMLWSKTEKVMPTTSLISMRYKHLMAGITIALEKGHGFTTEEWTGLEKVVLVENTITGGKVNLVTGICTVGESKPKAIKPLSYGGVWRAVVFPQTVNAGKTLLSIDIDGQTYKLTKDVATTFLSGKMHNITITVNRSSITGDFEFVLAADDIVAWIDDLEMHEGLVKQYTVIEVDKPGTMSNIIDSLGIDPQKIISLKVKGTIDYRDFECISGMESVVNLNMREVSIVGNTIYPLKNPLLASFIFPEKGVKAIAPQAFMYRPLRGSLEIPEGVETIGAEAFMWCGNLYGNLKLPSTLKRIDGGAFAFTSLKGELRLPDGLEYIDPGYYFVFQGCDFEGSMYLPESLEVLPPIGFPRMTGKIIIPQKITSINDYAFVGTGCSEVMFHDGITEIGCEAFQGSSLSGELVLPPNLKKIRSTAFYNTKISKIIFPDNLRILEPRVFSACKYLTGTVTLPKNVARIPIDCFSGCSGITGLVVPAGVELIDNNAFSGCSSIGSIICEREEPPLVCDNAFYGVNKDNFTVEVPKGCVEKYRNAQGWGDFKRIAEYSNFVCRPAQANALNAAHSETLILNADAEWEVEYAPEWCHLSQTSGKGKTELRLTFSELQHGAGNRKDSILFRMIDEDYTTYCSVSQFDYMYEEDSYLTIQNHTKGEGIDIMFIGDGWTGEDISNGSYLELIRQQVEYFFAVEPYKSHREYFNVNVAFPLSQERGVNTMYTYVNNRFGTLYGFIGDLCSIDRLLTESDEVIKYAYETGGLKKENRWRSMIILVPNSDVYSGVTEFHDGMPLCICPPSNRPYPQDTRGVIQHEAGGHGFGRLADEEITYSRWATPNVLAEIEAKQRNGWYKNIATTSKMSHVPWADFIFDPRYSDYVDIYEGAYSYMRGVFRSEANSCMNYGIPYFNTISRLEIMKRIFNCARQQFTMDYFYANDTNEWGDAYGSTRAGTEHVLLTGTSYARSNLHNVPQEVNASAQGISVREIRAALKEKRDSGR